MHPYRKIEADIHTPFGSTIAEQIEGIRSLYREKTGSKLSRREAIEALDRHRADCRDAIRRPKPGMGLACPFCYGPEQDMYIETHNPTLVTCLYCDEQFTVEEAIEEIADTLEPWTRYLAFLRARRVEPASTETTTSPALAEALAACGCEV